MELEEILVYLELQESPGNLAFREVVVCEVSLGLLEFPARQETREEMVYPESQDRKEMQATQGCRVKMEILVGRAHLVLVVILVVMVPLDFPVWQALKAMVA